MLHISLIIQSQRAQVVASFENKSAASFFPFFCEKLDSLFNYYLTCSWKPGSIVDFIMKQIKKNFPKKYLFEGKVKKHIKLKTSRNKVLYQLKTWNDQKLISKNKWNPRQIEIKTCNHIKCKDINYWYRLTNASQNE